MRKISIVIALLSTFTFLISCENTPDYKPTEEQKQQLHLSSRLEMAKYDKDWDLVICYFDSLMEIDSSSYYVSSHKSDYKTALFEMKHDSLYSIAMKKKSVLIEKNLKKLRKNHDDISGITWYENRYYTHYNNSNHVSLYMGKSESSKWLRLFISYYGNDWIFFETIYLSFDGNTIEIPFNRYDDKETDNEAGKVWEWIDINLPAGKESFMRLFAESKNAKVRFVGKYQKTRKLSQNERKAILSILDAYDPEVK